MQGNQYSELFINLGAICENYRKLKSFKGVKEVAPVLKANGYGLGAEPIYGALAQEGATNFFVAYFDEGVALRQSSFYQSHHRIYVLNGPYLPGWAKECEHYNLTPVLNSAGDMEALETYGRSAGKAINCTIHIDTGMRRLGVPLKEWAVLDLKNYPRLNPLLLMSHLTTGEDPLDPHNKIQRALFLKACEAWHPIPKSLANSSALFLGEEFMMDMVRPGMALYGLNPTPITPNVMKPVVHLRARILQIQTLEAGESLGYGQKFKAKGPSVIATIALGYADGLPWSLSNNPLKVRIGNHLVPIVGRVSMDLVTLDITGVPSAQVGDWVTIMDEEFTADQMAARIGVIPYEILTNLGNRYKRVYGVASPAS